jgi:hypothetical protein
VTPTNILALEPLIIGALRAALPDHVYVLAAADLADVQEDQQPTPAVHVLYGGAPVKSASRAVVQIDQRWWTVIADRNLSDPDAVAAARASAGELAVSVITALLGHDFPNAGELVLSEMPKPIYRAGHIYLPLGWNAPITMERQQCP